MSQLTGLLLELAEQQRDGWRALSNQQAVLIEDLEHEVGRLREVLRRAIGYLDSVRSLVLPPRKAP